MNSTLLTTRWQRLPEKVIRELQAEKLRRYLQRVVLPFSAYYRELFREHGIKASSFRSLEDLERIPFTSKVDLLNTPEHPQRAKEFILIPDQEVLRRRASTLIKALVLGRDEVKRGFESEFRPIFMTSTTGRSADPIPFLFTQQDIGNLSRSGDRIMQICRGFAGRSAARAPGTRSGRARGQATLPVRTNRSARWRGDVSTGTAACRMPSGSAA